MMCSVTCKFGAMFIISLKQSIELFTDRMVYCLSKGVEMRIDDFRGDDIRIIKMLYETIVNVEGKGLLPNRVSIGLEQELIRFISVVNDNNIGLLALREPNNDVYWAIMVVYELASQYFELVNAENGIRPKKKYYSSYVTEYIIKHEIEFENISKRLFERLHDSGSLNYETGKPKREIPKELDNEKARKWLQRAIDGGLLNNDYTTTEKVSTKPQKALLAEILSEKIGIENKWDVFEKLWGAKGFAKVRYKSREETGKVRGGEFIEAVFAG